MPGMWWVVGALVVVGLVSAYLFWTANRVERLQTRAESAARALDAHLLRRAAAAAVLAEKRYGVELYAAARIALDAVPEEREAAENDLTRQLRAVELDPDDPACEAVIAASRRLALARQVHTDLVRDARAARRRPWCACCGWGAGTISPGTSTSTIRPSAPRRTPLPADPRRPPGWPQPGVRPTTEQATGGLIGCRNGVDPAVAFPQPPPEHAEER
ncbi:hypothetical protein GA0070604_1883 [Micromonospora eburnea]|uniref:LemA protein n=1 Tax=Micromonospora eburnea TaxID=227316 RepID=A0A1C6U5H2_9ACTN|nr:hypothetical protein GA0070604_1883 [Micromonospora eburnea]